MAISFSRRTLLFGMRELVVVCKKIVENVYVDKIVSVNLRLS